MPESRTIGGIPVNNIWFLLFYASDMMQHTGKAKVDIEEAPDQVIDLIAEMLLRKVERRLKGGMTIQYIEKHEILNQVKGRINFYETEVKALSLQAKISCRYTDLTTDIPRNRYIRHALETIVHLVEDPMQERRARLLVRQFREYGVLGKPPTKKIIMQEKLGRFDIEDKGMLDAAHLVFDMALLNEKSGPNGLFSPEEALPYVRKLFPRALAGFYHHSLRHTGWQVDTEANYEWEIEALDNAQLTPIEDIGCDVALHHEARGESYLIDAKFQSILTDEGKINRYDLYPLFTLLTTQSRTGKFHRKSRGLIVRPAIGNFARETFAIKGCEIRLCTVDLAASAKDIRNQLLSQVTFL
ncbi:MAG: hypothetical protein OXE99_06630 [Cellvibrionales bacterium]|nr:hypothetical protein [Cellvibrionales bacterium]